MSIPSFNPSVVTGYGTCGEDTARKMSEALQSNSLALTYDTSTKKFTILGSAHLDSESIGEIFTQKKFEGWEPQVLNDVDDLGNRMVKLAEISSPSVRRISARALFDTSYTLTLSYSPAEGEFKMGYDQWRVLGVFE